MRRGRQLLCRQPRTLNRRGPWPLVSGEKGRHAQPPLAAMPAFPSPGPPPEDHVGENL